MTAFPDLGLTSASRFVAELGLIFDSVSADRVTGHLDLGPRHHNAWNAIHGGVYCTIVERAGSVGASRAVAHLCQFAVGISNSTDTFVTEVSGRVLVDAHPLFQDQDQQLWAVAISSAETSAVLARGQLRLENVTRRGEAAPSAAPGPQRDGFGPGSNARATEATSSEAPATANERAGATW
ncbi:MAG: PaaI family thioesterase [Pseudonocardiaceae bacterium]